MCFERGADELDKEIVVRGNWQLSRRFQVVAQADEFGRIDFGRERHGSGDLAAAAHAIRNYAADSADRLASFPCWDGFLAQRGAFDVIAGDALTGELRR